MFLQFGLVYYKCSMDRLLDFYNWKVVACEFFLLRVFKYADIRSPIAYLIFRHCKNAWYSAEVIK